MTHQQVKAAAEALFGACAVVHGKFLVGAHGEQGVLAGVCAGDRLVDGDHREAVAATVIVVIHRREPIVGHEPSPEDFMEDPQRWLPPKR